MNSYSLQWLINKISENLSSGQAEKFSEFAPIFFETITEGVKSDGAVVINGFGIFTLEDGRITFMPDSAFADAVNLPFAYFEPIPVNDESLVDSLNMLDGERNTIPASSEDEQESNAAQGQQTVNEIETEVDRQTTEEPVGIQTEEETQPEPDQIAENPDTEDSDARQMDETEEEYTAPVQQTSYSSSMHIFWIILVFIFGAGIGYVIGSNYPYYERWTENNGSYEEDDEPESDEDGLPLMTDVIDSVKPQPESLPEMDNESIAPQETLKKETTVVYDTISKNRFLSRIARKHYGSSEFWSYIYLENAGKLGNPDRIPEGTVLVIPAPDKYGIDASDPSSISRAKNEQSRIYQKFKK